jgi:hypothetical protein
MLQSYSINYYVCYMVYILLSKLNRGLCTLIDLLVPDSKGSSYRYCLLGDWLVLYSYLDNIAYSMLVDLYWGPR